MSFTKITAVLFAAVLVVGCSSDQGNKQTVGTLGGAVLGGLLGAQFGSGTGRLIATGAGALAGGLLGQRIGKSLDEKDQLMAERTAQASLEHVQTGERSTWSNPDSGATGSVTPTRTFQNDQGENCREFQQTVTIGGETEEAFGTACRQDDGSWKIVSS